MKGTSRAGLTLALVAAAAITVAGARATVGVMSFGPAAARTAVQTAQPSEARVASAIQQDDVLSASIPTAPVTSDPTVEPSATPPTAPEATSEPAPTAAPVIVRAAATPRPVATLAPAPTAAPVTPPPAVATPVPAICPATWFCYPRLGIAGPIVPYTDCSGSTDVGTSIRSYNCISDHYLMGHAYTQFGMVTRWASGDAVFAWGQRYTVSGATTQQSCAAPAYPIAPLSMQTSLTSSSCGAVLVVQAR